MTTEAVGREALAAEFGGRTAVVAGLGITGESAVRALHSLGASVVVIEREHGPRQAERLHRLADSGIPVAIAADVPGDAAVVVTSPGWRPDSAALVAAAEAGIPVWGDVELARRLRPDLDWLAITGTNGKTTTVRMVEAMLLADGRRAAAAGNVGAALLDVVADPAVDVIAAELSSFQLHYCTQPAAAASVVLNVAPDHLDWHGSLEAYAADKGRIHVGARLAAVFNVNDPLTRTLVERADVVDGCRAVGFGLGAPARGELGVVEDLLVDRAFSPEGEGIELAGLDDVHPFAPHNVANALAAAALVRAYGVAPASVAAGLRGFQPEAHRIVTVATVDGVAYVDDSKATNPHAALAALRAYDPVVWVAGGLAKGASFDELVGAVADRLRAVVLIGRDRGEIAAALARHAPEVPVVDVPDTDNRCMTVAVGHAARLASPGDTVLLSPACASMDLFTDYAARGDAFAAAVTGLPA